MERAARKAFSCTTVEADALYYGRDNGVSASVPFAVPLLAVSAVLRSAAFGSRRPRQSCRRV